MIIFTVISEITEVFASIASYLEDASFKRANWDRDELDCAQKYIIAKAFEPACGFGSHAITFNLKQNCL